MDYLKVPTENYLQFDTPQRQSFFTKTSSNSLDKEATVLGRGSYGVVYSAVYKSKNVAIKIIPKHDIFKFNSLQRESNILNIQHENILRVLKIVDTSEYGAIIMEKFKDGKPLQYLLDRSSQISLRHRLRICRDIISALSYCHSNQICHADLKPLNIMVVVGHDSYQCKLFDFGCSFKLNGTVQSNVIGTARYCAPELLQGKIGITTSIDIFSFGIIMWQLKENEIPYSAIKSNDVVIFQVVRNNLRPDSTLLLLNDLEKSSFKEKIMRNQFCKSDLFETKLSPKLNTPTKAPLSKSANRKLPKAEMSSKKREKVLEIHRDTKKRSRKNLFLENFMAIDINDEDGAETPKCFKNFFADSSPCDKHDKLFDIENNYINLYKACWHQDPCMRPSTDEVFKLIHQFLSFVEH